MGEKQGLQVNSSYLSGDAAEHLILRWETVFNLGSFSSWSWCPHVSSNFTVHVENTEWDVYGLFSQRWSICAKYNFNDPFVETIKQSNSTQQIK